MEVTSIGHSASYGWNEAPLAEGNYDENGVFTLTGNGQGVYWCWDRCGAALVENPPLTGSFTFTARVKSMQIPDGGVGQVGILVKGLPLMRYQVLSLRWDTYWEQNHGTGLAWFNRITPIQDMELGCAFCEKLCHGVGQGCLGKGYESSVDGFPTRGDLWLRVKRIVEGNMSKYYLYARYGENSEWTQIQSTTSTHNPCGATQTPPEEPLVFPHFMVLNDNDGMVRVGLFVAHSSYGEKTVTAEFDNITIEADNTDEVFPDPLPNTFGPETVWWDAYMGPYSNFSTKDCDYPLVDRLGNARKVWRSEVALFKAKSGSQQGASSSGGAGPIVAEGKVFLWYQDPTEHVDGTAPDIALAIDAEDGHTVWKKTLDRTIHDASGKNFTFNQTVGYADGKVFVAGGGGALYCLRASDGEQLWKSSTAGAVDASAVMVIGGTIVVGMGGGRAGASANIGGYDTADGSQLWFIEDGCGGNATPTRWKYEGKEYVLAADAVRKIIRCIEPKSGDVRWTLDVGVNEYTIPVYKNHIVVNMGCRTSWECDSSDGDPYPACFSITPDGAEKVWDAPRRIEYGYTPIMYRDRVYHINRADDSIATFDLFTGDLLKEQPIDGGRVASKVASNGMIVIERDGNHSMSDYYYFDTDEQKLVLPYTWVPPHMTMTSYAVHMDEPIVDGRMFIRGEDAMYCYDLRKNPNSSSAADRRSRNTPMPTSASNYVRRFGRGFVVTVPAAVRVGGAADIAVYDHAGRLVANRTLQVSNDSKSVRLNVNGGSIPRTGVVRIATPGKSPTVFKYVLP